ncbi:MAG: tRNA (N(6)-L-threonylcarbamoyladenosine(37)-C(2))-methylthiotransferase MtaB [Chloroflexi bacterium]|nr:tRNA (N(6)-L-threonylcarbamoyladenosine(37)-C(2))-methylthiotransferase MtaB [Chloroflexota bacterium]
MTTVIQPFRPSDSAPRVRIETHGCKLNMADSQRMAREFVLAGYAIAMDGDAPDVYVLDSCTVTQVADRKARQSLARARRSFPDALIVATGCLAQRDAAGVEDLAAVDLVVTNREKRRLTSMVTDRLDVSLTPRTDGAPPKGTGLLLGRSRASLKIQEGCDQVCSYCIVPYVRGRERSVPQEILVQQVARLVDEGCREVVLTGTQLGSYGFDLPDANLSSMLRRVLGETEIERLRVSSLQPGEITPELLEVWSLEGDGRLCPHFHMPLQSGSDPILTRMRRRYTREDFVAAVGQVRSALPDVSITGDAIAGFPGESEEDHRSTLEIVERVEFADLHVFPYSERPGTSAAHLEDVVDLHDRARRAAELRERASRSSMKVRQNAIGAVRPVLWENETRAPGAPAMGLTDTYLRVRRDGSPESTGLANEIERVRLVRLDGETLVGEPV